jgi:hypothetical protein
MKQPTLRVVDQGEKGGGQIGGGGGSADLIIDDPHLAPLASQAEHGGDEVAFAGRASRTVEAARPDDEVAGRCGADEVLAGQLGDRIHTGGAGGVAFAPAGVSEA